LNIPWISTKPDHWHEVRAKNLFHKQSRPVRAEDDVVTCFRDGMVTLRKNRRTTGFTESTQWSGYQGVCKGDLVIHVMDAFAGSIGVSDSDGKSTPVYSVCTPKSNTNNYYYAYLLREMARTGFIQSLYRGIRERSSDFRFEVFAGLFLPVPPQREQDQIVRYLDWKVSQINKLINAKRKQIGLLNEFISAKVDGVFRSTTDRETSLSRCTTKIGSGKTPRGGVAVYVNSGIIFIRSQNVYASGLVSTTAYYITDEIDESMKSTRVYKGDVLLNITGGSLGRSCVYDMEEHANVNQHVCIIRPNQDLLVPEYLVYFLNSPLGQEVMTSTQNEGNRESLTFVQIGSFKIPLPTVAEQKQILTLVNSIKKPVEAIIKQLTEENSYLAEYRTRLISDVVTGKFEVQGVTVPDYEVEDEIAGVSEDIDEMEADN